MRGHQLPWASLRRRVPVPARADRAGLAQLHEAFTGIVGDDVAHAWTREEMIRVGQLYVAAWGTVPKTWRLQRAWCLPDARTVRRHFGSLGGYYAALADPSTGLTEP